MEAELCPAPAPASLDEINRRENSSCACVDESCDETAPLLPKTPLTPASQTLSTSSLASGEGECRICFERDPVEELCAPCNCIGHLKWVHPHCLQRWCQGRGLKSCEICQGMLSEEEVGLPLSREGSESSWESRGEHEPWSVPAFIDSAKQAVMVVCGLVIVALSFLGLLTYYLFMWILFCNIINPSYPQSLTSRFLRLVLLVVLIQHARTNLPPFN
eukprot:Rmarinus@m.6236